MLRIASRSGSNRAQLLRLGILPSLTRLMKVTQTLLSAATHTLSDRGHHGLGKDWPQQICLLVLSILIHLLCARSDQVQLLRLNGVHCLHGLMKVSKELECPDIAASRTCSGVSHCSAACERTSARTTAACPSMALVERHALCAQVGLLRLTALAARLGPSNAASGGTRLMAWFLQCLLAHCLSAINTLVAGEVQAVLGPRPDVMDRFLGKGAAFCSRQARRPGTLSHMSYTPAPMTCRLPQSDCPEPCHAFCIHTPIIGQVLPDFSRHMALRVSFAWVCTSKVM